MKIDSGNYIEVLNLLKKHQYIALQVSGGRDSLAMFYLMREHDLLNRVTVYWLNTGDAFAETLQTMAIIKHLSPCFVEIDGKQPEVVALHGIPTDILPRSCTPIGIASGQSNTLMQDSYSCCARVIMEPMHRRMLCDDVTLIIRGQRKSDTHKAPLSSGDSELGITYFFPIENWTDSDVDAYLVKHGAPKHSCYEYMSSMPDCKSCTGWWDEKRSAYLKACHPKEHEHYQQKLDVIRENAHKQIFAFNLELQVDDDE